MSESGNSRRPRAVAWDVDGTLIDSEPLHHRALLLACARWQADMSDITEATFLGVHIGDVWIALQPRLPAGLSMQAWRQAIHEHYLAERHSLVPIAGALESIRELAQLGVPQVCVSNSSRRTVDANLRALGVLDQMAFSISLDDVTAGKPDPQPYAMACQRLGLSPGDVLAVEDSLTGATSARAAGLRVALYCPGGRPDFPANAYLRSIDEVLALFACSDGGLAPDNLT